MPTAPVLLVLAALAILVVGLLYRYVVTGGMRARQKPSSIEAFFAGELVQLGIRKEARDLRNPLGRGSQVEGADVAAGRDLFQRNCQVCHGSDGRGGTAAGGGLYPPPLDLSRTALEHRKRTDGELFFLIRNGIRNTGMPGWQLPDRETWQLVAFVRDLPETAPMSSTAFRTSRKPIRRSPSP